MRDIFRVSSSISIPRVIRLVSPILFIFFFFFLPFFFVFHWPSIFLLAVAHWLFVPSLPPYRSISIRWPVRFLFSFAFRPSRQIRARTDFHVPHRANFGNQAANLRYDAIEFYFISLVPRAIYTMVLCSRHFRPGIDKSDGTFGLSDLRVPLCTVIALRFEIFGGQSSSQICYIIVFFLQSTTRYSRYSK